ncbi:MAG: bifunctional ornithine acetyltransferase/N-acetylglutamate synthase [Candidatus Methanospirare jalkutatii]|nr:bifunctional ornithine acetyltransferase/N-acetylglutamate synthase [Candidatus Methanospirare jalkutatii]
MEEVGGGVCAVRGVKASGVKEGNNGLALILGGGSAAGMFTANKLPAETVIFTKRQIERSGRISAVIANSGCANSFTGEEGLRNAERMAELVSDAFEIPKEEVAVASTGPIGKPLDMNLIERQFKEVAKTLTESPEGSTRAAKAIMTTDTFHKEIAVRISENGSSASSNNSGDAVKVANAVSIGGIAKGSGMIFPHLEATMLAFIYTDASLSANTLRECLREAVENSFNMIVVDGDMSTNDLVLLVSTGDAECEVSESAFKHGLNYVCEHLARMIARDGEGATKFIEVRVKGAASVEDARRAARAVIRSPLVKCSLFGEKPFWGRVIAALGASGVEIERKGLKMWFGSLERRGGSSKASELVAANGKILNPPSARRFLRERELFLEIDLGVGGEGKARAWGCDFSYDYVKINS